MLCSDGKISLWCYLGTVVAFTPLLVPLAGAPSLGYVFPEHLNFILSPILVFVALNVLIRCFYLNHDYQVAVRSVLLGFIFALGLYLIEYAPGHVRPFGIYMCVMSFFHYTEFLSIALIKPKELSTNSFLLYHSHQYVAAAVTSWLEFFCEGYFFPEMKMFPYVTYLGLVICVGGEFLRKLAMLTARSNFNHLVQCTKADDHVLVTHGIYGVFRHPSYVGWFYWSIGTQIILLNPLCVLAYTAASWLFFNERIIIEEITLLNFFGQQYCDYQQRAGTGLPFIKGYRIKP